LKILITSPTYPPFNSGLGNAVHRQAIALVELGMDVTLATGGAARLRRTAGADGIVVEEFNITGAQTWLNPIRGDVPSYVRFLKNSAFDVVIMHAWQNWATDIALANATSIAGRKYLFSHCVSTNVLFPQRPLRSLVRYALWRPYWWSLADKIRRLDGIFFLSEGGDDSRFADLEVAQRTGIDMFTIPNSLSSEAIDALSQSAEIRMRRRQIISVGSYHWQKGFDFVMRAYAASAAKNVLPIKLFGQEYTPFIQHLSKLADQLGIEKEFIQFNQGVGGVDLISQYAQSALFIYGSHTECQPLVLLDCAATGTPFVARRTGCISSMPGGVAVDDIPGAASAIDRLMSDHDFWAELANRGREAATSLYHPKLTTQQLVNAICPKSKNGIPT
jgi:1,2-diacylglycerol 3-alpha-glucosyltransferase